MAAKINIQVSLATAGEKYVEAVGGGDFLLAQAAEDLSAGQLTTLVNPIGLTDYGLAFLYLGEFQTALEHFDEALNAAQNPTSKGDCANQQGVDCICGLNNIKKPLNVLKMVLYLIRQVKFPNYVKTNNSPRNT